MVSYFNDIDALRNIECTQRWNHKLPTTARSVFIYIFYARIFGSVKYDFAGQPSFLTIPYELQYQM